MKIIIWGASDDLIEIDGDIYEEFEHGSERPFYSCSPDGHSAGTVQMPSAPVGEGLELCAKREPGLLSDGSMVDAAALCEYRKGHEGSCSWESS